MNQSEYIRVDSIHDIDPNKLSLSYVGKKFIDKENNRFSIRFNKDTRKMEIVRLVVRQSSKPEAEHSPKNPEAPKQGTLSQDSKSNMNPSPTLSNQNPNTNPSPSNLKGETKPKESIDFNPTNPLQPESSKIPLENKEGSKQTQLGYGFSKPQKTNAPSWNLKNYDIDLDTNKPSKDSDPSSSPSTSQDSNKSPTPDPIQEKWKDKTERDKIDAMLKKIEETRARVNAVLVNIKSSRIFEITGDPSENQNIIGNLTREFDVEVFQHIDAATNYLKELTFYPRAISYYTAKFERSRRKELANTDDKQKLHLVIRWEMQEAFTKILENLKALIVSLLEVLNMKSESQIKQLQYMNQMLFRNAKDASVFISHDVDKLIKELEDWKYETASVNYEPEPKRNN